MLFIQYMPDRFCAVFVALAIFLASTAPACAQDPELRFGTDVSRDVEDIYDRGLEWLAANQGTDGNWQVAQSGTAFAGINLMAFLACGEDPNHGKYADNIRRVVRFIIRSQGSNQRGAETGYFPNSMYHHGFTMLGLAEAYGAVDEDLLWEGDNNPAGRRTIGEALDLAVRCAVTSQQNNNFHAWRYSPQANDADTSVAGAVLMGLLAARNAGIKVPDESIDQALEYFQKMSSTRGEVGYSGMGNSGSPNLKAIAVLVFSIGHRKDVEVYQPILDRITGSIGFEQTNASYLEYYRYYTAQALFQGDFEAWKLWNEQLVRKLKDSQQADGSFSSSYGPAYGTGMALLALGLNYRFLPIYER